MKLLAYLICVIKGHNAYMVVPWGEVNTFNFCRRCGQHTRDYYSPQNWYEVENGESDVSPLY